MYRVNFLGLLVFLLFIMGFESCKKDCYDPFNPDCVDYDPCIGEVKADAEFGFYKRKVGTDTIFWIPVVDTFYNWCNGGGNQLFFRANNSQMDNYEWTVGSDPRTFTDSIFFLNFECISGQVNTTLRVDNEFLEGCFSDEMKIDIATKGIYMKILPSLLEQPIYGKYEGFNEGQEGEVFTIELKPFAPGIIGFPMGCNNASIPAFINGRNFMIDVSEVYQNCGRPEGFGFLQEDNQTLIIEYKLTEEIDGEEKRVNKRFIGTRID